MEPIEREVKMYHGTVIARYDETAHKKQKLWDKMIKWCIDHNATSGESAQRDDFNIDAPDFMSEVIDDIIQFETEDIFPNEEEV